MLPEFSSFNPRYNSCNSWFLIRVQKFVFQKKSEAASLKDKPRYGL